MNQSLELNISDQQKKNSNVVLQIMIVEEKKGVIYTTSSDNKWKTIFNFTLIF
jgi:hypothetical protein